MPALCDLHIHSYFSDGSYSPTRLVQMCLEAGLASAALCDHNTIAGLEEFAAAGSRQKFLAVPGIEFSTDWQHPAWSEKQEFHILALFVRPEHHAPIKEFLADSHKLKDASNRILSQRLREAGYPIDYDALRAGVKGVPNRADFARTLVELGYLSSTKEAFRTLLNEKGGLYTPPPHPDSLETIRFIRSLGLPAVLAHPLFEKEESIVRLFLDAAVPCGLTAMETLYSEFTPEETRKAKAMVAEYGLLESGGSDFHGNAKSGLSIGVGYGSLAIPDELRQRLEQTVSKPEIK